jgi:hypothetical protein
MKKKSLLDSERKVTTGVKANDRRDAIGIAQVLVTK